MTTNAGRWRRGVSLAAAATALTGSTLAQPALARPTTGSEPFEDCFGNALNLYSTLYVPADTTEIFIGTDGDGNNDSDERNIFGGITWAYDRAIVEWYGGTRTNMVVAGNYFGMGVDGATRFTNSLRVFGGIFRTRRCSTCMGRPKWRQT